MLQVQSKSFFSQKMECILPASLDLPINYRADEVWLPMVSMVLNYNLPVVRRLDDLAINGL